MAYMNSIVSPTDKLNKKAIKASDDGLYHPPPPRPIDENNDPYLQILKKQMKARRKILFDSSDDENDKSSDDSEEEFENKYEDNKKFDPDDPDGSRFNPIKKGDAYRGYHGCMGGLTGYEQFLKKKLKKSMKENKALIATNEELNKQIGNLLAEIEQLKSQINNPSPETTL